MLAHQELSPDVILDPEAMFRTVYSKVWRRSVPPEPHTEITSKHIQEWYVFVEYLKLAPVDEEFLTYYFEFCIAVNLFRAPDKLDSLAESQAYQALLAIGSLWNLLDVLGDVTAYESKLWLDFIIKNWKIPKPWENGRSHTFLYHQQFCLELVEHAQRLSGNRLNGYHHEPEYSVPKAHLEKLVNYILNAKWEN